MRQERFHVLALILALLAHVLVGSGVLHDHLDGEQPGSCVSCGVASQTVLVPVVSTPSFAASTVAPPLAAQPGPPARPCLLPLDARGPPFAGLS